VCPHPSSSNRLPSLINPSRLWLRYINIISVIVDKAIVYVLAVLIEIVPWLIYGILTLVLEQA
jgi:hypothetical protein